MTHDTTYPATEDEDGVHSHFDYRPEPNRLSPNGAKKILKSPARFDYDRKHPQEPKRAFDFGAVAHKLVLGEGHQFLILDPERHGLKKDGTVADNPRATTSWKEAETNARADGLVPIHIDDYRKAVEMADAVHAHETAGPLLADGDAEVWLYWTDLKSGQKLRTRLDFISAIEGPLTIVEYKTVVDASPEGFARSVFKFGYHIAAAFAVAGVKAHLHENPRYLIVAQEKEPPYLSCVHALDVEAFSYGCQEMQEAIAIFKRCREADKWPGYPLGTNMIPLPAWAISDEMEFSA